MTLRSKWLTFLAVLVVQVVTVLRMPDRAMPPVINDSMEVQNIGYNLAHGRGYRFDWDDGAWRQPYRAGNGDGRYGFILGRHGSYPTLCRPPLMPLLVAGLTRLTPPRDLFLAWRLFDAVAYAGAACLLCDAVVSLAGLGGGGVLLALVLLEPIRRRYVPDWWTEGLAFDGMSVLVWLAVRGHWVRWSPHRFVVVAGAAIGLLCLTRAIFTPLVPALSLVVATATPSAARAADRRWRDRTASLARDGAVVLVVACLAQLPWWARNVWVAGRFLPLGTQGGLNLPDEYGSWAVFYDGLWTGRAMDEAWMPHASGPIPLPPGYTEAEFAAFQGDRRHHAMLVAAVCTSTASEVAVSRAGTRAAVTWVRSHPLAVPGLMAAKAWTLFRGGAPILTIAAACVVAAYVRRPAHRATLASLAGLAGCYVLSVLVTHVVYERFVVPLLPPVYVLIAVGTAWSMPPPWPVPAVWSSRLRSSARRSATTKPRSSGCGS